MGRTTTAPRVLIRILVVAALAATGLVGLTGTSWASDRTHAAEEAAFVRKINETRSNQGLGALTLDLQLTRVARGWTDQLTADGSLSHNPLVAMQVEGDWTRLGENVGYSTRSDFTDMEFVGQLHRAFMASPAHRANILGNYNQVGVGVRMTGDTMWVTVNFMLSGTAVSNGTVNEASRVADQVFAAKREAGHHAAYVVLTASDQPQHAMGGAALAGDDAPLLYTHPATDWDDSPVLHPVTRAQIDRVLGGSGLVYAIGGTDGVSDRAVRELINDGYTVRRLAGSSTPSTLAAVANETVRRRGDTDRVVIANSANWKSSVAGAVWSARSGAPFLVTGAKELHPAVRAFLSNHRPAKRYVMGSTRMVSRRVQQSANATRITGATNAATSVSVAKRLWGRTDASDGDRWASAPGFSRRGWGYTLAYAPWSASQGGPALLVNHSSVPDSVASYLHGLGYGGNISGHVRAASMVPRPVVDRVQNLVAAP
jgi:uncharacterized protein YkwD